MSYGVRGNTRITHPTPSSILSLGSWLSFHLGHVSTEFNGKLISPRMSHELNKSDIPMPLVSSGVENGNLRELALARMKDFGAECRDVRYREVGVSQLLRSLGLS